MEILATGMASSQTAPMLQYVLAWREFENMRCAEILYDT